MACCGVGEAVAVAREAACRNRAGGGEVKLISVMVIFVSSVVGISLPVVLAKCFHGKAVYEKAILVIKCFAAGVILSTSLVHVLPDAFDSLSHCSLSSLHPWKDFPFAGLLTLLGSLLALLVHLTTATSSPHHHHQQQQLGIKKAMSYKMLHKQQQPDDNHEAVYEESAAASIDVKEDEDDDAEKMRQRMVSQALEIGIIFHSIIIGVTLGLSQNVCTIRPLVAALSFHQIFEGMGLGGCIAQAGFSLKTTAYMCFMFSVTTPVGILLGMLIFSVTGFDDTSANALILEGLLGSVSSGILIYMALVDLISADFFHNKMMSSEPNMKKGCFVALLLGSASMSILALWA